MDRQLIVPSITTSSFLYGSAIDTPSSLTRFTNIMSYAGVEILLTFYFLVTGIIFLVIYNAVRKYLASKEKNERQD